MNRDEILVRLKLCFINNSDYPGEDDEFDYTTRIDRMDIDSLDIITVMIDVENEMAINLDNVEQRDLITVGHFVDIIKTKLDEKTKYEE